MAKRKKPCDVPSSTTFFRIADQVLVLVLTFFQYVFSQSESPSEHPSRCEVESSVFTTPGDTGLAYELETSFPEI